MLQGIPQLKEITPVGPPTDEQVRSLETQCSRVLECLSRFAAPWVIEFAGLPRSGKTGCIGIVEHLLRRNNFAVLTPAEGARNAPEHLKDDLIAYNAWTATYAIQQILEGATRSSRSRYYNVVLLDRGLFDATAWFHFLEKRGNLDEQQRKTWAKFLRSPKWAAYLKQVFFFQCNTRTALSRELEEKLTTQKGLVLAEDFLSDLNEAYNVACECYGEEFEVNHIETDTPSRKAIAYMVAKTIFDGIEKYGTIEKGGKECRKK